MTAHQVNQSNGDTGTSAPFFLSAPAGIAADDDAAGKGSSRPIQRWPGNKSADGVFHRIIGLMPPHDLYIEAFVGSGAIFRNKKPARSSIVIDADERIARYWRQQNTPSTTVVHGDARTVLLSHHYTGRELVYCDPPYLRSARRSTLPLYRHEMTDEQHSDLLVALKCLPCAVMISGYRSGLYDDALRKWQRVDFLASTHGGTSVESVWCNFTLQALHDWRYLGRNFRERERIKRKRARWVKRLATMPQLERAALLAALLDLASPEAARAAADDQPRLAV